MNKSLEERKEDFIKKANKKFNNKFAYTKIKFKNLDTEIKIVCPKHGSFTQKPTNHLNSVYGCWACYREIKNISLFPNI